MSSDNYSYKPRKREYGEIKMYNSEKGFGFIIPESTEYDDDLFFHISRLSKGVAITDMIPGTKVSFEVVERKRKEDDPIKRRLNAVDVGLVTT